MSLRLRSSCSALPFFALLLSTLSPLTARAEITQPNGVVMPRDSANGEVQLYTMFASLGEPVDWVADGEQMPATFSPLCDFEAELVLRETASSFAVGWYNVDDLSTTPPAVADIQIIVPAGSPVGTRITGADIRSNPAYRGGAVGFALVGGQTHYSEARHNPVCTSCSMPGPWIMAVIYRSLVMPNTYYLAFEDGAVGSGPGEFNNDGDYNDYVYRFTGITCEGGGVPCDTGMSGICAAGLTQCTSAGVSCNPLVPSRGEACDGLDEDCDGMVDEGDGLCGAREVCDRGVCVGRCMGEFGCAAELACNEAGLCVEPECIDVTCEAGEVCRDGECGGACTGVTCPLEQVCRAGRCVDPCDGVTCDGMRVCDDGVCVEPCSCSVCEAGLACDTASGVCETPSCVGFDCSSVPGTVCVEGACVDACTGASCPRGQICELGECIRDPALDRDAGVSGRDASAESDAGGGDDAGASFDAGVDGGRAPRGSEGGCGCRVERRSEPSPLLIALATALLATLARRKRR